MDGQHVVFPSILGDRRLDAGMPLVTTGTPHSCPVKNPLIGLNVVAGYLCKRRFCWGGLNGAERPA
jgi:hypothetical protein